MLPQPGNSRLTKVSKGEPIIVPKRIFSRGLLRRRRFYIILGLFLVVLYYLRIFESSVQPLPGYEVAYEEEITHAMGVNNNDDGMKYLHFKVSPYARVDEAISKLFLHAHLAHATNRVYVFDPLEPKSKDTSYWSGKKVQPLSSVLNLGDGWDTKGGVIQPLSSLGWHHVCPPRKRKYLQVSSEYSGKGGPNPALLMNTWTKRILKQDAQCIEIIGEPFPESSLESKAINDLFDIVSSSPVLKQYVFRHNIQAAASSILPTATQTSLSPTANNTVVLQSYLPPSGADDPCADLAVRGAPFRTFAHLRGIPTPFETPASKMHYEQRCNPTVRDLVGRLVDGPLGMTPEQWVGRKRWFEELRYELTTTYGWESVRWAAAGAKIESVAIDTELATRSHAYLGNGFTEFSSNIVLLRAARGISMGSLSLRMDAPAEVHLHSGIGGNSSYQYSSGDPAGDNKTSWIYAPLDSPETIGYQAEKAWSGTTHEPVYRTSHSKTDDGGIDMQQSYHEKECWIPVDRLIHNIRSIMPSASNVMRLFKHGETIWNKSRPGASESTSGPVKGKPQPHKGSETKCLNAV
ncbi:hypothetical protein RhiXN_12162 [Rhizoctonia solani]|uniref:Uncharacterized protein n=1 Tax=Rhizoctonia solani TaxID=456999 RepID=A0A8H8T1I7_9AGAM|nr:uncharacterized protein RhiXN_12162 [Rhizoctonia solani]QRW26501.1 hypothetical protein RhiXN_12162 [Rhizoctonia solani]